MSFAAPRNSASALRVAFATCSRLPELTPDDRLALDYLKEHGVAAHAAVWDSPEVVWEDFDCVVIRSCWDYHHRPAEFAAWILHLEERRVAVWNPPNVIRWNTDKKYLKELQESGILIAPTVWRRQGDDVDLKKIFSEQGWSKVVVKPTISATAFLTWISTPETIKQDEHAIREMFARSGVMIQQFIEEVPANGEWSFVFFNKEFSHAVLKRAREGEFRVQNEYGGFVDENASPEPSLIEQARRVLELIETPLLYARVDGIEIDGRFMLMELELIEPYLFFSADARSVARFTQAFALLQEDSATAKCQEQLLVSACN